MSCHVYLSYYVCHCWNNRGSLESFCKGNGSTLFYHGTKSLSPAPFIWVMLNILQNFISFKNWCFCSPLHFLAVKLLGSVKLHISLAVSNCCLSKIGCCLKLHSLISNCYLHSKFIVDAQLILQINLYLCMKLKILL